MQFPNDKATAPLIVSELLRSITGIAHGFTTRDGGVSVGAFAHMNLGLRIGDGRSAVLANRQIILRSLQRPDAEFIALRQVHGDAVVEVTAIAGQGIEADGLWTCDRRAAIAVLVADCVPILLADKKARAVAAVHAGWRGTQAKIILRMLRRLNERGIANSDLVVSLGPAIGPCCFEIGPDVAEALRKAFPEAGLAISFADEKYTADLWALNRLLLIEAGVPAESIDVLRTCTVCTPQLFSYRREQGNTGRQGGVITFAPPR